MVTSLKNLKTEIDDRLAEGGLTALACCQLQNAETLANNFVYSVANTASLPDNLANEGRLVYVEDIKEYRLANDSSWTDDVSSGICVYQTQIWAWGINNCGQLGDGTSFTNKCSPIREICSATDWCQLSTGTCNTIAIKTSGELWGWGSSQCWSLGDGTTTSRFSPVREICSATDWCQVSAGHAHTTAVKTTGQIWVWGLNNVGQLGDGTTTNRCSPVREFCSATDWCQVGAASLAGSFSAALKTSGEIWSWGSGSAGQLGNGAASSRCSPVREFCSATDWCFLSVGFSWTAAIKTSGELWTWGSNTCGQLGNGTATNSCSPVREICSATDWCYVGPGREHTVSVKTSGEIWAWGRGFGYALGNGTTTSSCSPVREYCSATDWCQVSSGRFRTSAVKTSGQLWAWGINQCGMLGDGTTTTRCSPVREICSATDWCYVGAGCYHTVALRTASKGFLE